jgi:hypothetical protein
MLLLKGTLFAIKKTVYLISSNMAAVLMRLVVVCKFVEICKSFCMSISTLSLLYGLHTMHNIKANERRIKLPCTVIHSVVLRNNRKWGPLNFKLQKFLKRNDVGDMGAEQGDKTHYRLKRKSRCNSITPSCTENGCHIKAG